MRKALICGCYRSGTTILGEMLDAHSAVCCTNELGTYCVGEGILRYQLRNKLTRTNEFLETLDEFGGATWYVDKHPLYCDSLPHAAQYVEKMICCLRHPLEVIESMLRNWQPTIDPIAVPWVFPTVEQCIKPPNKLPSWFDLMSRWEMWKASPTCDYLEVRYADMATSAGKIAEFLEIDGDELTRIFSEQFQHQSRELPAVELPREWLDLIDRLGLS